MEERISGDGKTLHSRIDNWKIDRIAWDLSKIIDSFRSNNPDSEKKLDIFLKACFKDINKTRALTEYIAKKDVKLASEVDTCIIKWREELLKQKVKQFITSMN